MKKSTTLDYIILGLIQKTPLSGYRIRKTFEDTALGNFGGSPGTIYPALNRLTENKLIDKRDMEGGKKAQFSITSDGLKHLQNWLELKPTIPEIKKNLNLLILKFAFMDFLLTKEEKLSYLEVMRTRLEDYLFDLRNYYQNEKDEMPINAQLAFEHGLISYEASLTWCKKAQKTLKE